MSEEQAKTRNKRERCLPAQRWVAVEVSTSCLGDLILLHFSRLHLDGDAILWPPAPGPGIKTTAVLGHIHVAERPACPVGRTERTGRRNSLFRFCTGVLCSNYDHFSSLLFLHACGVVFFFLQRISKTFINVRSNAPDKSSTPRHHKYLIQYY